MYVPTYEDYQCAYVYDNNWVRVYDGIPRNNTTLDYTDYNYNSHYITRYGSTTFNNYTNLPTCREDITTNFYQRTDILEICLLATLVIGWTWFLISKLVKTLLKGGRIK